MVITILTHNLKVTPYMEYCASWEANICWISQETMYILWQPEAY
jgi:hypothetical protein